MQRRANKNCPNKYVCWRSCHHSMNTMLILGWAALITSMTPKNLSMLKWNNAAYSNIRGGLPIMCDTVKGKGKAHPLQAMQAQRV
jgi:hypothetical protein